MYIINCTHQLFPLYLKTTPHTVQCPLFNIYSGQWVQCKGFFLLSLALVIVSTDMESVECFFLQFTIYNHVQQCTVRKAKTACITNILGCSFAFCNCLATLCSFSTRFFLFPASRTMFVLFCFLCTVLGVVCPLDLVFIRCTAYILETRAICSIC